MSIRRTIIIPAILALSAAGSICGSVVPVAAAPAPAVHVVATASPQPRRLPLGMNQPGARLTAYCQFAESSARSSGDCRQVRYVYSAKPD